MAIRNTETGEIHTHCVNTHCGEELPMGRALVFDGERNEMFCDALCHYENEFGLSYVPVTQQQSAAMDRADSWMARNR